MDERILKEGKDMRIMMISTLYPENEKPQLKKDTQAIKYFVDGWVKKGHDVLAVHPYRIPIKECMKALADKDRFKVFYTEQDGAKVLLTQSQLIIPHRYVPFSIQQRIAARKVKKYMSTNMPEFIPDIIVVSFPLTNLEYCEEIITDKKAICILHKSDITELEKSNNDRKSALIERLNKCFVSICFRSDRLKERGIALGIGDKQSTVLYSGVKESLIAPKSFIMQKAHNSLFRPLNIVYAGNLVKRKNIECIITAVAKVRKRIDVTFKIIGDGNQMQELRRLCYEVGILDIVEFTGQIPRDEVINAMRQADVFAMLSVNETFGLVYIEAMAQGCIVIGTKDDGIDGVIVDGVNGYLSSPYSPDSLSNTFYNIARMSVNDRTELICNSYNTVLSMTDEQMTERYLTEIEKALSN